MNPCLANKSHRFDRSITLQAGAYSQVKGEMLTQLKTNSKIRQDLQRLGYADERIPAWVAEAAPEPDPAKQKQTQTLPQNQPTQTYTLPPAPTPAIRIGTARKKGAGSGVGSSGVGQDVGSLQNSSDQFTVLQKPQSAFDAANKILGKGGHFKNRMSRLENF
jgi:hypothetical protein